MEKNELIPKSEELSVYQVMAKTASQSKLFEKMGGEAGLLSIMLMARELGLPPLQSVMGGMNIIQGKVEISPRMMNTMIRKAGHRLEIITSTDQECKIKGIRHDTKEEYIAIFSLDDAKRAGLVRSGGGWEKYASDMLFARCISRLARRLFADVISTAYVEGEIDREEPVRISNHVEKQEVTIDVSTGELKAEEPPQIIQSVDKITTEEAQEIENLIRPEDKEYRLDLLKFFSNRDNSKIDSFFVLPRKYLKACMKSVVDRRQNKPVEAKPLDEQEIPF